jgi:hypothetical protein
VAILASILSSHMSLSQPPSVDQIGEALTGYRTAFGVAVAFCLIAALAAWFIRDSDAEATMSSRRR